MIPAEGSSESCPTASCLYTPFTCGLHDSWGVEGWEVVGMEGKLLQGMQTKR